MHTATQKAPIESSAAAGLLLVCATVAALVISNSPLDELYSRILETMLEVRLDGVPLLNKPLLHWINDGLMAVFFLLVGLEIKREVLEGTLSSMRSAALPLVAALGGMLVPALIYTLVAWSDPVAMRGWAIPTATDIAFALGILALVGSGAPLSLKVLLTAIAVIDDLGAIVIIALFYTDQLSTPMLAAATVALAILVVLRLLRITNLGMYLVVGAALWFAVLKSGVHATLAGVAIAAFIPHSRGESQSPLLTLEHAIQPWTLFFILPLFASANAGVDLRGLSFAQLAQPTALGTAAGLLIGKVIGVVGTSWIAIKLGMAELPEGVDWRAMLCVGFLCGIGFTMSLFIGTLAFEQAAPEYLRAMRLGVLLGSSAAAFVAIVLLRHRSRA